MSIISNIWANYIGSRDYKPSNLKKEINRYNRHVLPYWKDRQDILELKRRDILEYKAHLFKSNLSPQSVKLCLALFRAMLNRASDLELYTFKVPVFEMPRINNHRIRYLTKEEAFILLSALRAKNKMWYDIALFALYTGMRAGEIFSIKKSDINFAQKTLAIFETKNSQLRIVPLSNEAIAVMAKYAELNLPYFFSTKRITEVSTIFRDTVKATKINDNVDDRRNKIVFHSLRHTFASWLVQKGVALAIVSQLLGHKSLQMTMRYAHLAPFQGQHAVELLPSIISPFTMSIRDNKV